MRDWEQSYREGCKPWDKGSAAPPLIEWLSKQRQAISGQVLVPGCGLGHDVRLLARHTSVWGLDISSTAVREAEAFSRVGEECYKVGDLFALSTEKWGERFDWVWEHTCFCAIDPAWRDAYVEAVWSVLKSGGHLLGVFYLDPYDDEHQPGGDPPYGCSERELRERFVESGRFEWLESSVPQQAYPGREGRELLVQLRK